MKKSLKRSIKKNNLLLTFLRKIKNGNLRRRYKNFDLLFSNVYGGRVTVKLNNIPGAYLIDARSHLLKRILLEKAYEPEITTLIKKHLDLTKDVINVGANIGLFANFLANQIDADRKVIAVEPTNSAFELLEQNTRTNNNQNKIVCVNAICSDRDGNFKINVIPGKEEYASLGPIVHTSVQTNDAIIQEVKGFTLDHLVEQHQITPGFLLIDVEGAELDVLKGALNTLKTQRPVIITEVDDSLLIEQKAKSTKIIGFLRELNYTVEDIEGFSVNFPYRGNIIAY